MKRSIPFILLAAMAVSLVSGQTENNQGKAKSGKSSVEEEFKQIENQWAEADKNKDAAALGRLLADDWTYLGPVGIETKAQHLAGLKTGADKLESITLIEMKVRVFENTAVVTGREHEKSTNSGKDTSGDYLWTDVFVKRQGHWLAVNSQDTPLTSK
jgi:ketosteroid isomerase-like protein